MNRDCRSQHSTCVYTVMIGGYETLNEFQVSNRNNIDFICFTDNPDLQSDVWEIVQVAPIFPMDSIRSQRAIKVQPHLFLPEYDRSLYIDNTVRFEVDVQDVFDEFEGCSGIGVPSHSFRSTVLDEFLEVARLGYDDSSKIFEQLNHYIVTDEAHLSERPNWLGIIFRDHRDPDVRKMMEIWWAHISRYSRRDQLSFNYALRAAGVRPRVIDIDNYKSWFHTWPYPTDRKFLGGNRNPAISYRPALAQARALEQEGERFQKRIVELESARSRLQSDFDAHEAIRLNLQSELAAQEAIRLNLQSELAAKEQAASDLEQQLEAVRHALQQQSSRVVAQESGRVVVDGVAFVRESTGAAMISRRLAAVARRFPRGARFSWRVLRLVWWTVSLQLFARLREVFLFRKA